MRTAMIYRNFSLLMSATLTVLFYPAFSNGCHCPVNFADNVRKKCFSCVIKGIASWLNIAGCKLCWIVTPAKVKSVTLR